MIRTIQAGWAAIVLGAGIAASMYLIPGDRIGKVIAEYGTPLPFGPHFLANAGMQAGSVILFVVLLLACDGLGLKILRWLGVRRIAGATRLAAVFLGYIALSSFLFGSSMVGLWYGSFLFGILALAMVLSLPYLRGTLGQFAATVRSFWSRLPIIGKALAVSLTLVFMPLMMLPETNVDSMTYHLTFPQQILQRHKIFPTQIVAWAKPNPADQVHVFSVILRMDPAARQVCFALALIGVIALLKAIRIPIPPLWGLIAVASALLVPAYRTNLTVAKSDAIMCGFALAGTAMFLTSGVFDRRRIRWQELAVAGLLLGTAVATKFLILPFAGLMFLAALIRTPAGARARVAAVLVPCLALPILPWSAKSWIFLADPLAPIASIAFPRLFGDPEINANARQLFAHFISVGENRSLLTLPGEILKLLPLNAFVFFAAIPFMAWWRGGRTLTVIVVALVAFLAMVAGIRGSVAHVARYTYPLYVILNLIGALAIADRYLSGRTSDPRRRRIGNAIAVGAMLGLLATCPRVTVDPRWADDGRIGRSVSFFMGRISADEYRRQSMASYGAVLPEVRKHVSAGRNDALLIISEEFAFDIPARVTISRDFRVPFMWKAVSGSDTIARLSIKFRQAGMRWILYNPASAGWDRKTPSPYVWTPRMLRLYVDFARRHLRSVASSECERPGFGTTWLLSVIRDPLPPNGIVLFLPGTAQAFHEAVDVAARKGFAEAAKVLWRLHNLIPEVVEVQQALGHALVWSRSYEEGYWHVRAAAKAGLIGCLEPSLINWFLAAGATNRREEAEKLRLRAIATYSKWTDMADRLRTSPSPLEEVRR